MSVDNSHIDDQPHPLASSRTWQERQQSNKETWKKKRFCCPKLCEKSMLAFWNAEVQDMSTLISGKELLVLNLSTFPWLS